MKEEETKNKQKMEPRGVEPRSPVQNPWCIFRYTKVPSYYLYYFDIKFNLIFYLNHCKDNATAD